MKTAVPAGKLGYIRWCKFSSIQSTVVESGMIKATGNVQTSSLQYVHSRKLTWKPKKGPIKTTVLLKGDYMGFHVCWGECAC